MKCERVLRELSPFLDGVLDDEPNLRVSQHLGSCPSCGREFTRLRKLQERLRNLPSAAVPDYLHSLVQTKIGAAREQSWRNAWRSALEYRWSRIRTTEGIWYLTRAAGVMATAVFFVMISSAMNPMDLQMVNSLSMRPGISQDEYNQQLWQSVLRNLGVTPLEAQRIPISPQQAKINDLNMVNFGQNASRTANNDTVSLVAYVDRSGKPTIQDVLEYPEDEALLDEFASMILSATWRPASRNGRAVDSRQVLTFSKVLVSN
jgi:hypothetical protein